MNPKLFISSIFFILFLTITAHDVSAQKSFTSYEFDTSRTYVFKLEDRSQLVGKLIEKDSTSITIKTSSVPRIQIPYSKIKAIDIVNDRLVKKGVYWFENPNATRYFFGPSAFPLKKGEGYYQNSYLFLNSVSFGVTNNISFGGGFELISTVLGKPIFFLTPKVSFKLSDKFRTGVGVLYANLPTFASDGRARSSAGIMYGLGTYGSADKNITGGLGWGFIESDFSAQPVVTISGITRVSRRVALLTENYFIPADGYSTVFSYGARFFGEKIAIDLGFINNRDIFSTFFIGIPYVDFVVKFN
jgi:hypothetical protein